MKVVLDNNLPRSLAVRLAAAGMEAVHVVDIGLSQASDQQVREQFAHEPIVFVSRDEEFWLQRPPTWAIVWVALHNPTLAQLRGPIADQLVHVIPALRSGQRALLAADQVKVFGASS